MSKAFTRDENEGPDIPDVVAPASILGSGARNYITPAGAAKLREELRRLIEVVRPELAAESRSDPDVKRQLARLDQRIMQLEQSVESAEVVQPPVDPDVVRFGACVTVREMDGTETSYRIVGVDETDADQNWVSWVSPIAKALLNHRRGERIRFKFPSGEQTLEIIEIAYE